MIRLMIQVYKKFKEIWPKFKNKSDINTFFNELFCKF